MKSGLIGLFVLAMWGSNAAATAGVAQEGRPTFRASTDLVTVAATVRTRRGRPVVNLKPSDFQLLDSGKPRTITDFKSEPAPVSVALLVDFSGSMEVGERRGAARDAAAHIVNFLKPEVDQAGLYVFDQKLHEVQAIAPAPGGVWRSSSRWRGRSARRRSSTRSRRRGACSPAAADSVAR